MRADNFRDPSVPLTESQQLLRKQVLYQIEQRPDTFYMGFWDTSLFPDSDDEQLCTTTRCLAGWALCLSGMPVQPADSAVDIEQRATAVLGLTEEERHSASHGDLFYDKDANALLRLRELAEQD